MPSTSTCQSRAFFSSPEMFINLSRPPIPHPWLQRPPDKALKRQLSWDQQGGLSWPAGLPQKSRCQDTALLGTLSLLETELLPCLPITERTLRTKHLPTAPQGSGPDGKFCPQWASSSGCFPRPPEAGSLAAHMVSGASVPQWVPMTGHPSPAPLGDAVTGAWAWHVLALEWKNLTLKCPVGSGPWLSGQDYSSNLSLHWIKPTWEILPCHGPDCLPWGLLASRTCWEHCTEVRTRPDPGTTGPTLARSASQREVSLGLAQAPLSEPVSTYWPVYPATLTLPPPPRSCQAFPTPGEVSQAHLCSELPFWTSHGPPAEPAMSCQLLFAIIYSTVKYTLGFPGGVSGKESTCKSRRHKRCGFNP